MFIGEPTINFGAKHYAQDVIDKAKETVDSKVLCRPRAFPIEIQQVGAQPHSEIETSRNQHVNRTR